MPIRHLLAYNCMMTTSHGCRSVRHSSRRVRWCRPPTLLHEAGHMVPLDPNSTPGASAIAVPT